MAVWSLKAINDPSILETARLSHDKFLAKPQAPLEIALVVPLTDVDQVGKSEHVFFDALDQI